MYIALKRIKLVSLISVRVIIAMPNRIYIIFNAVNLVASPQLHAHRFNWNQSVDLADVIAA